MYSVYIENIPILTSQIFSASKRSAEIIIQYETISLVGRQ